MPLKIRKADLWRWLRGLVPFTNKELLWAGASASMALMLVLVLLRFGVNVFKHQQSQKHLEVVQPFPLVSSSVGTSISEFRPRTGSFGAQQYVVSVQSKVDDGTRTFRPVAGCPDFLVIDVKYHVSDIKGNLHVRLSHTVGVESVEVHGYKIIVNRPCVSAQEMPQLWSWEEVWKEVMPVLEAYFNPKSKK
ncbi:hypothetical protein HY311_01855 [Candidatus Nomurabacteria bacterium]|nr:hypothetical protein [Candidatus Nomurabacteria bacterium]